METTSIPFNHEYTRLAIILLFFEAMRTSSLIIIRIKAATKKKTLIIILPLWSIQAPNKHTVQRYKLNE